VGGGSGVSLHKRLFYFKALLWESIILLLPPPPPPPPPTCKLLHDQCAIYAPHRPPLFWAIYHMTLVMGISCTGQVGVSPRGESAASVRSV